MYAHITTIFGIPIYSYGACIAVGLLLCSWLLHRNKQTRTLFSDCNTIDTILRILVGASLLGGKLSAWLHAVLQSADIYPDAWSAFTESGIYVSGSVVCGIITLSLLARHYHIHVLSLWDYVTRYAPLMHMFGRIGCFFAGCCHGCITTSSLAITYTDPASFAPLHVPLHPVQLYTALWHLHSFFWLWYYQDRLATSPGMTTALYICSFAGGRIFADTLRGDTVSLSTHCTLTQISAGILLICGILLLIRTRYYGAHA